MISEDEFRNLTVQNLMEINNYVIYNYDRKALDEQGGGHIRHGFQMCFVYP
jgi:hypothetical protein